MQGGGILQLKHRTNRFEIKGCSRSKHPCSRYPISVPHVLTSHRHSDSPVLPAEREFQGFTRAKGTPCAITIFHILTLLFYIPQTFFSENIYFYKHTHTAPTRLKANSCWQSLGDKNEEHLCRRPLQQKYEGRPGEGDMAEDPPIPPSLPYSSSSQPWQRVDPPLPEEGAVKVCRNPIRDPWHRVSQWTNH